jgi:hypothetical protein
MSTYHLHQVEEIVVIHDPHRYITVVITIFAHISISLQIIIYGLTYSSVNSEQIINSLRYLSLKYRDLLIIWLNIRASLRLWEGLHIDQLKSLQVHLT